jgi:hypothetical protein
VYGGLGCIDIDFDVEDDDNSDDEDNEVVVDKAIDDVDIADKLLFNLLLFL